MKLTFDKINKAIKHTGLRLEYIPGSYAYIFVNKDDCKIGNTVYISYLNDICLNEWVRLAEEVSNG